MIPILFENSANTFTTNGLGRLADATRVIVTEERNGIYELEMDYPVTGSMFSEIQVGRIIVCTHDEEGDLQPFDIYEVSEPIDGIATFYAHHISYRLNEIVVAPFTATTCANAIAGLKTNSIGTNPFTFTTDKTVTADYTVTVPSTLRGLLGGQEGSLLDVYGTGEYKFDNFSVSLLTNRGSDTSVSIRYGKNLIEFENNLDHSEVYNAVAPYWLGSEYDSGTGESTQTLVTLPEQYITANHTLPSGRTVIIPLDLSSEFETQPTVAQLRTLATSRLNDSDGWLPSQNITVNFVQLWQTDEYASLAPLQKVKLCDTVLVSVPMYNVRDLRIKVIKVVWNALLDRYDEMELGTPSATFATIITGEVDNKFDSTQQEINQLIGQLEGQIDAKIETWTQSTNPAANWTTQDARDLHNGDLWLYTGTSTITVGGVTIHPQGVYQYNSASNTWAAYSSTSSNLFDLVDGKTTIFYGTNTGTYANVQVGDYLVDSTNGKTYRWNGSAWVLLLDYKTYTNGAVSDAKVARTEIQYCLSNSNTSFVAYGSWSTSLPTYVSGKYYWTRTVTYYGDGTTSATTPVFYQSGQTAVETQIALDSTNNHFWYDNTGAYVTEDDDTYSTGYATRITNAGILQSYNGNLMSSWTNSGINFYSSDGITSIAEFGSNEARIGAESGRHIAIDNDSFDIKDGTIVRASFGDEVKIGRVSEYNTTIDNDSFDISSGYERVFSVSPTSSTKSITLKPIDLPLIRESSGQSVYRNMHLWIQQNTTYTFHLYRNSGQESTVTFDTSVDGTTTQTKSLSYMTNSATLTFTPAVDSDGNSGMSCAIRQTYNGAEIEAYLYRFYVEYTKSIYAPQMSFVGDIDLTDGGNYKLNGKTLDFVIERGTDYTPDGDENDWYYEKWSSGKVEAYFYGRLTGSTPTQTNTYYYRSSGNSFTIPSGIFPDTPICVGTNIDSSNTVMFGFSIKMTSATAGTWQIFRTNSNAVSFPAGAHFVYMPENY